MYYEHLSKDEKLVLTEKDISDKHFDSNIDASMIYQTFIDSLDVEDGEYSYPEYYGGAYIDSSNNMVFNTIDDSSMVKNDLQKRANSTNFIVRSTQHAYRDLRTTVTEVTQLMDEAIHGDEIYSAIRLCMLMDKTIWWKSI